MEIFDQFMALVNRDLVVDVNRLNAELRERLVQDGRFMVSRSTVGGKIILRSVIANRNITESSLDAFLDRVVTLGKDIERGLPQR